MEKRDILELGFVLGAWLLTDRWISHRMRSCGHKRRPTTVLDEYEIIAILKEMALLDYPLLTDLSQIANPALRALKETDEGREELVNSLLSRPVVESLLSKERSVLASHGIADTTEFILICEKARGESPKVYMLIYELEQMIRDSVSGSLPLLPGHSPNPELSADEILTLLTQIQKRQRTVLIDIVKESIIEMGPTACVPWLPRGTIGESQELFEPPPRVARKLRKAMRDAEMAVLSSESDVIESSSPFPGDRANFMHCVAMHSRSDKAFSEQWSVLQRLNESQMLEMLGELRSSCEAQMTEALNTAVLPPGKDAAMITPPNATLTTLAE